LCDKRLSPWCNRRNACHFRPFRRPHRRGDYHPEASESSTVVAGLISTEIFCRFVDTRGRQAEIQVPLPATPGFARTKEVVITFRAVVKGRPVDLSIAGLRITPIAPTDRLRGAETNRAVERL
jgi:hypothetical protein